MNRAPTAEFITPDRPSGPLLEEQFVTSELAINVDIHQAIESVRAQRITSKGVTVIKPIQIPRFQLQYYIRVEPTAEYHTNESEWG